MNIESLKTVVVPILQKHQVVRAGLFGSFARNEETEGSDVDLLVQFSLVRGMFQYMDLKFELEDILKRKVDLVEYSAVRPRLNQSIFEDEIRFYG